MGCLLVASVFLKVALNNDDLVREKVGNIDMTCHSNIGMIAYLYQQSKVAARSRSIGEKIAVRKRKSRSRGQLRHVSQFVIKMLIPSPNLAFFFNDHQWDISKF